MEAPTSKKVISGIAMDGAIPRMGLNIPVPQGTRAPPTPVTAKPAAGTNPAK
jgi:hypothetical protein